MTETKRIIDIVDEIVDRTKEMRDDVEVVLEDIEGRLETLHHLRYDLVDNYGSDEDEKFAFNKPCCSVLRRVIEDGDVDKRGQFNMGSGEFWFMERCFDCGAKLKWDR